MRFVSYNHLYLFLMDCHLNYVVLEYLNGYSFLNMKNGRILNFFIYSSELASFRVIQTEIHLNRLCFIVYFRVQVFFSLLCS